MQDNNLNIENNTDKSQIPSRNTDSRSLPQEPAHTSKIVYGFLVLIILAGMYLMNSFLAHIKSPDIISNLQRTQIGKTTEKNLQSLDIVNKEATSGGQTIFKLKSYIPSNPDEIITKDGVVVFERRYFPSTRENPSNLKISDFSDDYGKPEKTIVGSKRYGPSPMTTYIYAKEGFTLVGNSYTDELYEIQTYNSMTVNEYIEKYGDDIKGEMPKIIDNYE